jgi:hypothetical protein
MIGSTSCNDPAERVQLLHRQHAGYHWLPLGNTVASVEKVPRLVT